MSAAIHYLKDFDLRARLGWAGLGEARQDQVLFKEAPMNEIQRQRQIDEQYERDEDRAIYALMLLISGIGMAIMIGIAIIGAWAQFDITEFLKTIF